MSSSESELSPARHPVCTLEGENLMNNCAKRRRSPLLACLNSEQQPHAAAQLLDQPDATPATSTINRSPKFRGFSRQYHNGRCESRVGWVFGKKYIYLGTGGTREEAGHAYDIAAAECREINDATNFDVKTNIRWLRSGANSVCSQVTETLNSQAIPSTSDVEVNQNEETEFSFNTIPLKKEIAWGFPRKQDCIQQKKQSYSSNKSSQTALGILLQSSMFKKLVEKNMIDEIEENERKKLKVQSDEHKKEIVV
ncbi:hypothetical protein DCAR_0209304 [Daucus carota subsp. sativus]|uniref:AP2/ERF domain-containing protein n=1 Tax=Daucus carota subsp. sativus TaxID=79200 RepID=A0A166F6B5_DAUCS|nr:PREDICTED: AP2-like ethylene-responsive transcription factor ANT [Daucus carota subsp. sativus]WOG90063.1 hypothetical protein DCAR_0209304 [Daucus carota subsp. sativus]